jgi:hypothetical protein
MLPAYDVIELMRKTGVVFGKKAVLTAPSGPVRNQPPEGGADVTAQAE